MFFGREAESFLNASGARGARQKDSDRQERSLERGNRFKEAGDRLRPHYAEGGDVEEHRRGRRVGRAEGSSVDGDDAKMKAYKRGKRVHARAHPSDMSSVAPHYRAEGGDVEEHRKGRRVGRAAGSEISESLGDDVRESHRRGYRVKRAEGDEVIESHRKGRRVGRAEGDDVRESHRSGRMCR